MNKFSKIILLISILFFISGGIYFYIESNRNAPYFYESDINSNPSALSGYQATAKTDSDISNQRRTVITETVKKVSPAVVGINVIEIRQYQDPFNPFYNDPFFRQFFGSRGNIYNQKVKELGSGYIISPDGYIVTNDHVAGNAAQITVTLTNGKQFEAKLIGTDHASDISLLKIQGKDLPFVTLGNSDDIMIGEWVIALGNPFGLFEINDKPTVTVGVISAMGMNLEPIDNRYYLNMLQTDAAINGGNSGGPLLNSVGEVIGMNTLIYTAGNNQGSIGLGFAIPINKVKRIITELKENGKINRNFDVGLGVQAIDENIAKAYGLPSSKGVIVTQVVPGSPADKSDIKVRDIIVEVEKYKINNEETLISVFQEFRAGQTIKLKIIRDNKEIEKTMKLERK
ncbi:MAG TPA: trypsin-like peptidase domain-containing protein [Ignavibacteriaceae bacterium]|nr:trypsin-like peptidase domain-containing protein [Ignavibacteriaceae bacterium]